MGKSTAIVKLGKSSLQFKLPLIAVLLVLVPFVIFLVINFQRSTETLTALSADELESKSDIIVRNINGFINEHIDDARMLAQATILGGDNKADIIQYLNDIVDSATWIDDIDIIDMSGKVIASSGELDEEGQFMWNLLPGGNKDIFNLSRHAARGEVVVSEVQILDLNPGLLFLTPIFDKTSATASKILALEVNIKSFQHIISLFDQGIVGDKYVYIVDNYGKVVVTDDPSIHIFDAFPDLISQPQLLYYFSEQGLKGHLQYTDHVGEEVIVAYVDMNEFGVNQALDWSLVAIAPLDKVLGSVHATQRILLVIGFIIVVISMLVALWLARKITTPLQLAVAQAHRISAGDYSKMLDVVDLSEIGLLAKSFNQMAQARRDAEKDLESSEELFRSTFKLMPAPLTLQNAQGIIINCSDEFCAYTGYTREQIIGQNAITLNLWVDPQQRAILRQSLEHDGLVDGVEFQLNRRDGTTGTMLMSARYITINNQQMLLSFAHDITQAKHTEALLRRSQKMESIGELAGGIAHDFNNLLGIIIGNLDLISRQLVDDTKLFKQLETAKNAALRGASMTQRLLNFSRHSVDSHAPVNIGKVVEDFEELIRKSLTASISIEINLANDLWVVEINADEFEDALVNLSLNARDAMPNGGRLSIEIKNVLLDKQFTEFKDGLYPGEYVELTLSDTGTGIEESVVERIFDPFFTTKAKGDGIGLGLAMVYGFIKRSKGYITVDSKMSVGTTFTLYLPRSKTDQPTEHKLELATDKAKVGRETILIVDDEIELATLAKIILEKLGYTAICAHSGSAAIEILENTANIDLVFSDVVMPGELNGFELANILFKKYPSVKILLTSGFTGKINDALGAQELLQKMLKKPYREEQLAKRIRETLDDVI
jgi:PAS domain S-box-containing protein